MKATLVSDFELFCGEKERERLKEIKRKEILKISFPILDPLDRAKSAWAAAFNRLRSSPSDPSELKIALERAIWGVEQIKPLLSDGVSRRLYFQSDPSVERLPYISWTEAERRLFIRKEIQGCPFDVLEILIKLLNVLGIILVKASVALSIHLLQLGVDIAEETGDRKENSEGD